MHVKEPAGEFSHVPPNWQGSLWMNRDITVNLKKNNTTSKRKKFVYYQL